MIRNNKGLIGMIASGVVIFLIVLGFIFCTKRIPAGYVGVQYSMSGGIQDDVLTQGWHVISPATKITKYSVATEQLYMSADEKEGSEESDAFDVVTKDGRMNVDFEMSYSFNQEKVTEVYERYRGMSGEDVINNIIRGKIKTLCNEVTSQFTTLEAHMEKKSELNKALTERLREGLSEYGVTVESSNFSQTRVDSKIEEAITQRSKVSQELEAEKQQQEKTKLEAETKKIKAEGEATAKQIAAEAEANANKKLQESITPELLKKMEAEARLKHGWIEIQGATPVVTK